jgi:RNA polymerase sigma-70 factor (ECF subfamily)
MRREDGRPARASAPGEGTSLDFETFFAEVYPRLAQALLLLTADRAEAQDLAQEAMVRVYERWERIRAMESPVGYAYRTAMNLNRKRLRRLAVRARRLVRPPEERDDLSRV